MGHNGDCFNNIQQYVGQIVVPGQTLLRIDPSSYNEEITLGPGLSVFDDGCEVRVVKPGILHHRLPNVLWVNSVQKRYIPATDEYVLGVVTKKSGDMYYVNIGASELAALSYEGFEGATKRNRPDVKLNDLVYARVSVGEKDFEPELMCVRASNGKACGMGVIGRSDDAYGVLLNCSISFARRLLDSANCPLLPRLGQVVPFEIVVGLNGRLWVQARSCKESMILANAIMSAETLDNDQCRELCQNLSENWASLAR